MTRAERAIEARRLRDQGLLQREIGAHMGISKNYVSELLRDPDGNLVRARKASYRGTCEDCGAPTDGSNGRAKAPRRCAACEQADPSNKYWTRELVLDAIHEWVRIYGKQPTVEDWLNGNASYITAVKRERFYADGCWPFGSTVRELFGMWSAALREAGFRTHRNSGPRATTPCCGCGGHRDDHAAGCWHCYKRHAERRRRQRRAA